MPVDTLTGSGMSELLTVRPARAADGGAIARLSGELGYPAEGDDITRRLPALLAHAEHCVLVAQVQGPIVAWIHGFLALRVESNPCVEIGGLVVSGSHRGLGVGRALVQELRAWSTQQGVTALRVRCQDWRTDAHAFYAALGFTAAKTQKVFVLN